MPDTSAARLCELTTEPAFQSLQAHYRHAQNWQLKQLFADDPERFSRFSLEAAGLFLDYSKTHVSDTTLSLLLALAQMRGVAQRRNAMFNGAPINHTEGREVLHVALRAPRQESPADSVNADVHAVLDQMAGFTERVRSGAWQGFKGQSITDIVNIGIGGSYLGPKMACQALRAFSHERLNLHFVSNVDGHDLGALLPRLDPATTLFIIASKTFTTLETMMNAQSARAWFLQHAPESDLPQHFVAVSTNAEAVAAFGIDTANMFPFWDWVGGRYSVWSAIGLPVALAIGFDHFRDFLAGGHAMDQHFLHAPPAQNMPLIMGLIGVWYRNFFGTTSLSIAPYHQDLAYFSGYLQQLEMESNGKSVSADGSSVQVETCPVIWGDVGTNGQHAYFQLLHQGTDVVPVDFIAALEAEGGLPGHQTALLANCFAQSEAFMLGKTIDEVRVELLAKGLSTDQIAQLAPHRTFAGNRPSTTLLMDRLTPATLGALIALYEHKVLVQGTIWGINSFDQWGVELGKVLARTIQAELQDGSRPQLHDSSTNGLIARALQRKA